MNSLAVSAEDARLYQHHFLSAGPVDGKLPGAAARANLLQSGLPTNQLGEIWELADIDKDGALDFDEYCIALKLVFSLLHRAIVGVPPELPPSLIPQSKYRHFTNAGSNSASSTGVARLASPQLPLSGGAADTGATQPLSGGALEWYVPGTDRARYQALFAQHARGSPYVRALDVEEYLGSQGVARAAVSQAWALVDVRRYQQLNQEQFVYLMHVLSAHSRGAAIPGTLPAAVKDAIYSSLSLDGGPRAATSPMHAYGRGRSSTPTDPRNPGLYGERSGNVALADSYLSKLKTSSTFKNEAGSRYASAGKRAEEEKQLLAELKSLDEEKEKLRADYERMGSAAGSGEADSVAAALRELEDLKAYKIRAKQQAEESLRAASSGGAAESVQDIKQSIKHLEGHLSFLQSGQRAMDEFMAAGRQELLDLQVGRASLD
ncbi:endocytosis defective- protein [Coemansia nantahalensis]|uniref:Endocytosis defective- protein n=1 Tax=Coemansia nantahalensis TaxID=2789366 RepID=A0ACC1JMV8_9FUNG|nr:endocytosis defective- protein [Coemansia nantahalensis]